jgi:cytoskeleton protein RodZ
MPSIGETLREARMRQRLDIADVEDRTKIRAKYLRALENEEFGMLPGPTFVKTFLRTYAEMLGLDPHVLVEESAAGPGLTGPARPRGHSGRAGGDRPGE